MCGKCVCVWGGGGEGGQAHNCVPGGAELGAQDPYPAPPPAPLPWAERPAAQRPRPRSLVQRGRQSILQVNTAINNGVRRPGERGRGGVRLCPPGAPRAQRRTGQGEGSRRAARTLGTLCGLGVWVQGSRREGPGPGPGSLGQAQRVKGGPEVNALCFWLWGLGWCDHSSSRCGFSPLF